ncbi:unnamed protein product [Parnassius mnemosyne]|uniref:Uncharacterized protein n=1 Tax=Parnassius mnemosyne TaxID=213953 RepID=A0AAV1KMU2_9NEOP
MLNLKTLNKVIKIARNISVRYNSSKNKCLTMTQKMILYGDEVAPPVRFALMTAFVLGVEFDFRRIDLFASENKTELYKKINPLQKVPALVIGNRSICDSHVISLYFCRNWDKNNTLYPKDALTSAKVDEILFFNSSTLFPIDSEIFTTFFSSNQIDSKKVNDWLKALDLLENRLMEHQWLAGDRVMLCDICAMSTITSVQCLIPLADHHVRLKQWLNEIEKLSFTDINKRGLERLNKFIDLAKKP